MVNTNSFQIAVEKSKFILTVVFDNVVSISVDWSFVNDDIACNFSRAFGSDFIIHSRNFTIPCSFGIKHTKYHYYN